MKKQILFSIHILAKVNLSQMSAMDARRQLTAIGLIREQKRTHQHHYMIIGQCLKNK
jgi:predicted transcriptional regulator